MYIVTSIVQTLEDVCVNFAVPQDEVTRHNANIFARMMDVSSNACRVLLYGFSKQGYLCFVLVNVEKVFM